jgi:hypothetical protein
MLLRLLSRLILASIGSVERCDTSLENVLDNNGTGNDEGSDTVPLIKLPVFAPGLSASFRSQITRFGGGGIQRIQI